MNRIILSTTLTLATAVPFVVNAEDSSKTDDLNRFSLGPRLGMNFQAHFHNSAANPHSLAAPEPGGSGANHRYEDGYVLVDSSGNAGGLTWNWGYQNAAQVVGDTVQFHSAPSHSVSLPADTSTTDNGQLSVELVYQRVLGHLPFGKSTRWGLEAGFSYTDIDLQNDGMGTERTTFYTDAYQLNGVLPPGAGYHGTFDGPGALLGDTPTHLGTSIFNSQPSHQKLSGQLYTVRLGPFAEWYFTSKLSVAAGAGLAVAPAIIDYDFSELSGSGGGSMASGHSSKTGVLYGPYVSGTLRYDFTRRWGVYAGAQFQSLSDLEQSSGTHTAKLDPGAIVYLTAGVSYKF